ncbi:unnamed protein product, partial [Discosporangium mesarthrocarpum]
MQEMYTPDGSGVLITGDLYEGIRHANSHDLPSITAVLVPLE